MANAVNTQRKKQLVQPSQLWKGVVRKGSQSGGICPGSRQSPGEGNSLLQTHGGPKIHGTLNSQTARDCP